MKKILFQITIVIYLLIQCIFGYFTQTTRGTTCTTIMYSTVILAFLLNLAFFQKNKSFLFTFLGLLFTLIADFFLVILNDYYTIAVFAFIVVQICYFLRIIFETDSQKLKKIHITIRIVLSFLSILIVYIVLKNNIDLLSIVSVICYINLILNVIFSFINTKKDKLSLIFSIGLLLFMFCDLFVGLNNISNYLSIKKDSLLYNIIHCGLNIAWIFYTPCLALIGISQYPYYKKTEIS